VFIHAEILERMTNAKTKKNCMLLFILLIFMLFVLLQYVRSYVIVTNCYYASVSFRLSHVTPYMVVCSSF